MHGNESVRLPHQDIYASLKNIFSEVVIFVDYKI